MKVQCELCPKGCAIAPGESGECRIRINDNGRLAAVTYGHPCTVHLDPVEKKPLFHFLPGTPILSLATVGCNLHCLFCQNWEISQENPENVDASPVPPEALPPLAKKNGCPSVAYTYTEPLAYYEYTLDSCVRCREAGLKNVLVTAGYINPEPLRRLCAHVDAANIDLKGMTEAFYRDICGGTLKPVLDALVISKGAGVFVEVTNLIVPTLNDSDADLTSLADWLVKNLGRDTPLHFSRFFPQYRMRNLPPTPSDTLDRARAIALAAGLQHVYIGNVERPDGSNTRCPKCGVLLIERVQYRVLQNRLRNGGCPDCSTEIPGLWQ